MADLAERNASLEAAPAAAEGKANEEAAAHVLSLAKLEDAEEQLANPVRILMHLPRPPSQELWLGLALSVSWVLFHLFPADENRGGGRG